eukprot:scaffold4478_cov107-Skeletonema_dohrnii-CCMP3373.AAC.2
MNLGLSTEVHSPQAHATSLLRQKIRKVPPMPAAPWSIGSLSIVRSVVASRQQTTMMKYIYTTVTAVLIASLLTAEAWSPSSPAAVVVNRINQNHVIVAPHDVTAAHLTRSTTKLSATTTNKNTSLSRSTLASKLANNPHLNLIRSLLAKLTTFLTHKSKLVMLSTMLTIATFFPQSAVAAKSSLFSLGGGGSTKDSAVISTSSNNDGGGGGGVMKVGKFVVTVGAIGAGASTANKVMRNKFTDDDDENSAGGDTNGSVMNKTVVSKNEESPNGTTNVVQSPSAQQQPSTENKKTEEANNKTEEIEPLSEEWIQQQLNDAEKRSNVLNDAIKMTQQSQSSAPVAPVAASKSVTKVTTTKSPTKVNSSNSNKNSKKKVSVGNTIGIPPTKTTTTTSTTPLVKNLDSKIEMLQRRDAERSIQQQRINDEKTQVEIEKKKVALVEAERKIELAEMEYKKSQQQQQQIVAEEKKEEEATIINSAPSTTTTPQSTTTSSSPPAPAQPAPAQSTTPLIKVGPGGSPAKSKEEDLELTTQVILEYVKTMDSKSSGVVDDDSDDE